MCRNVTVESMKEVKMRLQSTVGVESNWNSFEIRSIRKFAIRLIRKRKKYSKNWMNINSKFVRFDSTPTIGWSQIGIRLKFVRFENLLFDLFKRAKNIREIRNSFNSTPTKG